MIQERNIKKQKLSQKKAQVKKITEKKIKVKKIIKDKSFLKSKSIDKNTNKFFSAIGKRKTSAARVRLSLSNEPNFIINNKHYNVYFPNFELQQIVKSALDKVEQFGKLAVSVVVMGGGIKSQAEAIRHGISRALVKFNPDFRKILKHAGFLTRDPRMRERKKFGLKRARRAPQWQKR
jgi:small subunit ribosomal protein S9